MSVTDDKGSVLLEVCNSLSVGDSERAGRVLDSKYPFERIERRRRSYSRKQATDIFVRDGFIDHYSGKKLVFPASLQLISTLLPDKFPSHPSGKMNETHIAFWELWPTIDHIVPVARGGTDEPPNCVCTSMLRNSVKSNWTLEELGWSLMEGGRIDEWDGLMRWFLEYTRKNDEVLDDPYLEKWWRATKEYEI